MIKAILLDMDDTLIVNNVIYEYATAMLYGYMSSHGISHDDAEKVFLEKDKELFVLHGYSQKRMPASFEAVLKHFVPDTTPAMVAAVRGFAERIFTTVAKIKPGTPEAIDLLAAEYPLYILTQGDRSVQEFRISHLPFKNKLTGVFIVDQKSPETFTEIVQKLGLKPEEVVMIGDSLKSDIITAVTAGCQAVWIEAHNSALFEAAPKMPDKGAYKFDSLPEAARHIIKHKTPEKPKPSYKNKGKKPGLV